MFKLEHNNPQKTTFLPGQALADNTTPEKVKIPEIKNDSGTRVQIIAEHEKNGINSRKCDSENIFLNIGLDLIVSSWRKMRPAIEIRCIKIFAGNTPLMNERGKSRRFLNGCKSEKYPKKFFCISFIQ